MQTFRFQVWFIFDRQLRVIDSYSRQIMLDPEETSEEQSGEVKLRAGPLLSYLRRK